MTRHLTLPLLLSLSLLAACAGQGRVESAAVEPAAVEPAAVGAGTAGAPQGSPPERAFPDDSIYPLLLAEFALRRRDYDTALAQYVELAPRLRDPGVSAHTTRLAQFLQREPEALEAVQLWAELEPDSAEANNTLALLLVRRGRNLEAVPHLAVVAGAGEEANFPILLNGFQQMDDRGRARLVTAINELAVEFPDNTQIMLTQALLHEELEQDRAALDKLGRLFEAEPYQTQAVLLEAQILQEQGARKPYARIESALAEDPANQYLRLQYARLLTRTDIGAAREQFEQLSSRSPRDGDLLLSLALINREMGDNLAAQSYLKRLLELGQREDDAHFYLGAIAEEKGELEDAIVHYMKVNDGRDFYAANGRIGRILLASGQPQRLDSYYDVLRGRFPDRGERLYALQADLHNREGDVPGAIDVLTAALAEYPESTSLRYSRSMLGEQNGDLALMESDLRFILQREPDNATALNALGYTLANRTQRYEEAYGLIARALQLQPDEPAILDSMGWVLYRQGQYEKAIKYLRRAYQSFPDPEVAAHLGEVLWVSGDTAGATAVWREGLAKDPQHEVLLATLRRFGASDLALDP